MLCVFINLTACLPCSIAWRRFVQFVLRAWIKFYDETWIFVCSSAPFQARVQTPISKYVENVWNNLLNKETVVESYFQTYWLNLSNWQSQSAGSSPSSTQSFTWRLTHKDKHGKAIDTHNSRIETHLWVDESTIALLVTATVTAAALFNNKEKVTEWDKDFDLVVCV